MRTYGTMAVGIRTPIIRQGDDLAAIVADSVCAYSEQSGVSIDNRDIVGVTEAVLARSQGNYAAVNQIAADVREKFPTGDIAVVFPIMSRNRFATLLKGIARGCSGRLLIQLSYPADEVGNHIIDADRLYEKGVDPYKDVFEESEFRLLFGDVRHEFTSIDYLELYRELGGGARVILANDPRESLKYVKNVIAADIHTRAGTKRRLSEGGAAKVIGLDDILAASVDGSGYNEKFGLLGSNKAGDERVKLFPRDCDGFVERVKALMRKRTGADVEVMVYGDGAFKDPKGKIWELADPVVSPGFTSGLIGLPNELKLKYLADHELADKKGEEAVEAMKDRIRKKDASLAGKEESEGTTPRRFSDLVGSLCDLVSGSGDKGTPVTLIKGYFDNLASE